ncbi:MAG: hypothetical protein KC777_02345 [Cyanobacteria bacterium HKST-UBA02]|nr:hypothetical protein [Cyanobacteria bacterium HKST-UBA02]
MSGNFVIVIRIVVLLFLFSGLTFFGAVLPGSCQDSDYGPYELPGKVMEMPEELRPGNLFEGYRPLQLHVQWHTIPHWLAGEWVSSQYRMLKSWDHSSGAYYTVPSSSNVYQHDHMGDLRDAKGTVWMALISPDITDVDMGNEIDCQNVIAIKVVKAEERSFALRKRIFHVEFDRQSRKINDAYTEEQVTEYALVGPSAVVAAVFNRFYDCYGSMTATTTGGRKLSREREFVNVPARNQIDLVLSLREHLQNVGLGDLIAY